MPQINLMELAEQSFGTSLEQLDDRRIYKLLVKLVQERSAARPLNNGKKKLYYISAEFLIGKLLINNMIDLGIYDEVKDQLTAAGYQVDCVLKGMGEYPGIRALFCRHAQQAMEQNG